MQRRRQSHPSRQIVRLSSQEFSLSGALRRAPKGQRGGRMVGAASAAWPKAASPRRHLPGAALGRLAARSFPRLPARAVKKRSRKNCREPRQGSAGKGAAAPRCPSQPARCGIRPSSGVPPGTSVSPPAVTVPGQPGRAWAGCNRCKIRAADKQELIRTPR